MEQSVSEADYVLIVCIPIYKSKSDTRKGGEVTKFILFQDSYYQKEMKESLFFCMRLPIGHIILKPTIFP